MAQLRDSQPFRESPDQTTWMTFPAPTGRQAPADLDIDHLWQAASDSEQRTLVDELVNALAVHPDHLGVAIAGAPRMNVLLSEVGLKDSQHSRVGGGT